MKLNELRDLCHLRASNKGFHLERFPLTHYIMLIVTELAEAVEADRKNNEEMFKEEIADVFIRLFDFCGLFEIDIEEEILKKMEKNKNRPHKHGKKY